MPQKWKNENPGVHERTIMMQKCGKKCFLGPKKSFPICIKGTCRISQHGVAAAFSRARQWKHVSTAKRAKSLLRRMNGLKTKRKHRSSHDVYKKLK
jgi:hypothetical protein